MAASLNKTLLTIRKRVAPNFLAKKVKNDLKIDSKVEIKEIGIEKPFKDFNSSSSFEKSKQQLLQVTNPDDNISSSNDGNTILSLASKNLEVASIDVDSTTNDNIPDSSIPLSPYKKIHESELSDNINLNFSSSNCERTLVSTVQLTKLSSQSNANEMKPTKRRCAPCLPKKRQQSSNEKQPDESVKNNVENIVNNLATIFNVPDQPLLKTSLIKHNTNQLEEKDSACGSSLENGNEKLIGISNINSDLLNKEETDNMPPKGKNETLFKKAVPSVMRKRPTPIISCLPKGNVQKRVVETCDNQNNEILKPGSEPLEQSKFSYETSLECSINVSSSNITDSKVDNDVSVDAFEKTNFKSEDSSTAFQGQDCVIGKNHISKNGKDQEIEVAKHRFLKRRVLPKFVNSTIKEVPLMCKNDSIDKTSSVNVISEVAADLPTNEEFENLTKENNTKYLEKCVNNSMDLHMPKIENQSNVSSSVGSVIASAVDLKEGILQAFINCLPQNPLSNIDEKPFFEGEKTEDLGKVCVFNSKKHEIECSDLKSIVDFDKVPKNLININFNNQELVSSKDQCQTVEAVSCSHKQPSNENEDVKNVVVKVLTPNDESKLLGKIDSANENSGLVLLMDCKSDGDNTMNHESLEKNGGSIDENSIFSKFSDTEMLYNLNCQGAAINEINKSNVIEDKSKGNTNSEPDTGNVECLDRKKSPSELLEVSNAKPYTLRQKKASTFNNTNKEQFDDGKAEDIFSNSEDSDSSEFTPQPEKKVKLSSTEKVRKKRAQTGRTKKSEKVVKERKVRRKKDISLKEKGEKKQKKVHENPSAFTKLSIELKNKNKWDEEGNCAEPEKLELKDYIFYVPKNDPMSQESKKETSLNENEQEVIDEVEKDDEEEENHGPKLIVKDGKIMVDPNSTKIKQTPVVHSKIEKYEKPKEPNDPWDLQETMRFYATLWKYGIDFSMLAGTFPKKSRDSIKKKFTFEERNNKALLSKTLTKKLDIKAVLRELVLIDRLMTISRKRNSINKPSKEPKIKMQKHCLLPKKTRRRNRKDSCEHSICPLEVSSHTQSDSNLSLQTFISENEIVISEDVNALNLKDIITFSTNVVYNNMNIVESVSFHPSTTQPIDVNVTISHDPVTEDTSLK